MHNKTPSGPSSSACFSVEEHGHLRLRRSRFGHYLSRGDVACAYHALKLQTIFFPRHLLAPLQAAEGLTAVDTIAAAPAELQEQLASVLAEICSEAILVPAGYDELQYLETVKKAAFHGPTPRVMVLHVTDYCNLRCRYCFIEGGMKAGYQRQGMSIAVMEAAIDLFKRMITGRAQSKPPSLVFYGGEPLANAPVVLHGLEYLEEQQRQGRISDQVDKVVISNGTMITPEVASALKAHDVQVSVSVDGPERFHDANRVTHLGQGTHQRVVQGIKTLREAGVSVAVSCVVSKTSVAHVPEVVEYLLGELGIRALGFNHVSIIPDMNDYDPEYEQRFADALLESQEIIQARYPDAYERRMNHKINSFVDRKILRADCTGCGEQVSISPDGKVGVCQGYVGTRKTFAASVFDRSYDVRQDPTFQEWSSRSPLNMEQCLSCVALATCGGGCPRNADMLNGSIWEVDTAFCPFAKKAQEWMIWKRYEVAGS